VENSKFSTRGDFSPTPVPRNRGPRSGSLKGKKGPPPLPPSDSSEAKEKTPPNGDEDTQEGKEAGIAVQPSEYLIESCLNRANSSSTETCTSLKAARKKRLRDPPKSLALVKKFSSSPCTPYSSLPSTPLSPNNPTFPVSPLYDTTSKFFPPSTAYDPLDQSLHPFPFNQDSRRPSHESQDEGVSVSGPTPTSVVKALVPLFAPTVVVAALRNSMTNKSR